VRRFLRWLWHQIMATDEEAERFSRVDDELRRRGL
jgi:hypothetical protein